VDRIDGRDHSPQHLGPSFQEWLRQKEEVILITEPGYDLLAHFSDDPPGNVWDEKDTGPRVHSHSGALSYHEFHLRS
jgi:hypothetical protein